MYTGYMKKLKKQRFFFSDLPIVLGYKDGDRGVGVVCVGGGGGVWGLGVGSLKV